MSKDTGGPAAVASGKIIAYEVRDNGEGYCAIVFATNCATARREGASELGTDWEGIESCRRRPGLDSYAPGPVPPMVLLDHGWWFECSHCGRRVSDEMADDIEDDGLDSADFVPRSDGHKGIYCSAECEARADAEKLANDDAKADLADVFFSKFPGAVITGMHVYGGQVIAPPKGRGANCSVRFKVPGCRYEARWDFGSPEAFVYSADVEAFKSWMASK